MPMKASGRCWHHIIPITNDLVQEYVLKEKKRKHKPDHLATWIEVRLNFSIYEKNLISRLWVLAVPTCAASEPLSPGFSNWKRSK